MPSSLLIVLLLLSLTAPLADLNETYGPTSEPENSSITSLYICEEDPNHWLRQEFMDSHPDVQFVDVHMDRSIEDPVERLGGFENLDIVHVKSTNGFPTLVREGLIVPLQSPEIEADHASYFPQAQAYLTHDGQIMGVPVDLRLRPWCVRQTLWDDFSLPEIPTTFDEYLDLIHLWDQNYAAAYPQYAMAGTPGWSGTRACLNVKYEEHT